MLNKFFNLNAKILAFISVCSGIASYYLMSLRKEEGEAFLSVMIILFVVLDLTAGSMSFKKDTSYTLRFIAVLGMLIALPGIVNALFALLTGF